MGMTTEQRRARLIELRGARSLQEIADYVGVSAQAVHAWEQKGTVSRKNAEAYDRALDAGGEVLSMLGYADQSSGVTLTTIDAKLDKR
jgi:transcriptional regulator with XRE-family HTH domain